MRKAVFGFASLSLAAGLCAQDVDYAREVHPLLVERCGQCHSAAKSMGGLNVSTRADLLKAGVLVPGKSGESRLLARVNGTQLPRMPMGGSPLSADEVEILRRWIDSGASGEVVVTTNTWKPVLAPRKVALPVSSKTNPIDKLLSAYFQGKNTTPLVSDALFARRAYLDLWGLLPPPSALEAFVRDQASDKRAKLVQSLLASPQNYAEHWVSFWNDLLHNDEGISYAEPRPSITPWLLKSLAGNLPYDQFAAKLLNPVAKEDPQGFLQGVNWRGDINASQTPPMQAAQNSAQVFLGVNLKCNSCHDSFISHWKLKEAYGLASYFSPDPLELVRCDVKLGEKARAQFLFPELGGVRDDAPLAEKHAAAAKLFTAKENGRFARTYVNRVWKSLFGRGLVEPIDDMDAEPWSTDLLDWLASDFADHGFDVQRLLTLVMTSEAYQLPAVPRGTGAYVFRGPAYRRLTAEQFTDAVSAMTGEWRVRTSNRPEPGRYGREWQFKPSNLSRMLGRPVRDFAVTERQNEPSTLQTLELVNGETLAQLLRRGAKRLAGSPEPAPAPLWDSGVVRDTPAQVDIDVTGIATLRLVLVNADSYDIGRVKAGWVGVDIPGKKGSLHFPKEQESQEAVLAKLPSEIVMDLRGKNLTRFKAKVGPDRASRTSDINAAVRAFVFKDKPNYEQLIPAQGPTPVAWNLDTRDLVGQLYRYALSRAPTEQEQKVAEEMTAQPNGLEDLLWCLILLPEFQYIR